MINASELADELGLRKLRLVRFAFSHHSRCPRIRSKNRDQQARKDIEAKPYKVPRIRKANLEARRDKKIVFGQRAENDRDQRRSQAAEICGQSHGWIERSVRNNIAQNWFKRELNARGQRDEHHRHQVLHPYRPELRRIRPLSFSIHTKTL